ncbi:DUF3102 domain-containing protein [Bosea sp. RCC_152_1]|uniref:DUF3102 domain-containing protein n=1 Tax=Bosea sp. RCC_152_1 TaxID=3239228 RepID=UPI0035265FC3
MIKDNSEKALNAIRDRIKAGIERIKVDRIKIGNDLIEAKSILKHGEFGPWLKENFNWSESSAHKFMKLAELAAKSVKITDLKPSVAMTLAAPSTPEKVVSEVLADLDAGKKPTVAEVKARIAGEKKPKRPARIEDVEVLKRKERENIKETVRLKLEEDVTAMLTRVRSELLDNQTIIKILKEIGLDAARRAFEEAFSGYYMTTLDEMESEVSKERAKWEAELDSELKAA